MPGTRKLHKPAEGQLCSTRLQKRNAICTDKI